ncbi:MAG TPA: dihydrofolate reductase family protein [Polyangiaceae bacterium]|nr:dihydrofolate reductase family protein [Polyangiaceae bacterium]
MSKIFVHVGMSLDGFIAGPNRGPQNPLGDGGTSIHEWMFRQRAFRSTHGRDSGGETGPDNQFLQAIIDRIGANILGKRMFDEGEANWPEEAPFHTPVFVLTHERRSPWQRPGGTTFHFVNDGIHSALAKAREVAGPKDIRISGGNQTIVQYLNAGLVDELYISLSPVLLGSGVRLFDGIDKTKVALTLAEAICSTPAVTHLRYGVTPR